MIIRNRIGITNSGKIKMYSALIFAVSLIVGMLYCRENKDNALSVSASLDSAPTIIVDAGHGGFDGGAVAQDGTVEKDINLLIAKKLKALLLADGFNVVMTRESDNATNSTGDKIRHKKRSDLQNRLALTEEYPDGIFVSVHLNKYTASQICGAQVFYSPNNPESEILAEKIQKSFSTLLQPENNRAVKKATSSTFVLFNTKIPAVIAECGFLSNNEELKLLKDVKYQSKLAFCIYCGVHEFLKIDGKV